MNTFIHQVHHSSAVDLYIIPEQNGQNLNRFQTKTEPKPYHLEWHIHVPLCHFHISHILCTLFAPQNFAEALFSISLGMAAILRRNEKQRLIYTTLWGAN